MYISRYPGHAISCNEAQPHYLFDDAIEVSEDLLDYAVLSFYHDVGGSIIVWRSIDPKTYARLDDALRKKGL